MRSHTLQQGHAHGGSAWPCVLRMLWLLIGAAASMGAAPTLAAAPASPPVAVRATEWARGLDEPWAMAFLPDASVLVTEKAGRMRRLAANGRLLPEPIAGLPPVLDQGQGGLLDVVVDPDGGGEPWVYWAYSEPAASDPSQRGALGAAGLSGTAVARGRLVGSRLQDVQVLFRQQPKVSGSGHFGARLVFARDKTLFITLGDRQQDNPARPGTQYAQNLATHLGKVVRINRDGSAPAGNAAQATTSSGAALPGALPEIWSYGHRNPQGAALHPETGELWLTEHGPRGGDELNRVQRGRNYGWPLRSYGCAYSNAQASDACRAGGGKHAPAFEEPLTYWVPVSIAPSGMAFYTASRHPQWRGQLFVGALAGRALWRITLDGTKVVSRQALLTDLSERIRDVRQGPDGHLYVLTDGSAGRILRIEPGQP